jgi:hypothetical protein
MAGAWGAAVAGFLAGVVFAQQPPPIPAEIRQSYTEKQLGMIPLHLSIVGVCNESLPGFRERAHTAYESWRRKHEAYIAHIERNSTPPPTISSGEIDDRFREFCFETLAAIEADVLPPDHRFATPEKTWAQFTGALARGDHDAAVRCFTSRGSQFARTVEQLPPEALRKMAASFGELQLLATSTDEFQDAAIETAEGKAYIVSFVRIGKDWKIASL